MDAARPPNSFSLCYMRRRTRVKASQQIISENGRAESLENRFIAVINGKGFIGGGNTKSDSELNGKGAALRMVDVENQGKTTPKEGGNQLIVVTDEENVSSGKEEGSFEDFARCDSVEEVENENVEEICKGDGLEICVLNTEASIMENQLIVSSGKEEGVFEDFWPSDSIEELEIENVESSHEIWTLDSFVNCVLDTESSLLETEKETVVEECDFSLGDFVWSKWRSYWWPGQIFDPNLATERAKKLEQKDCLLVSYYNGTFAWWHPSELKPFEENLVEFSKLCSSQRFRIAVQIALNEHTRLVEFKLSCSCSCVEELTRPISAIPETEKLSKNLSEPNQVLDKLKQFAQGVPISNLVESMVLKGWISAFYRAKGYSSLPVFTVPEVFSDLEGSNNAKNVSNKQPNRAKWVKSGCQFVRTGGNGSYSDKLRSASASKRKNIDVSLVMVEKAASTDEKRKDSVKSRSSSSSKKRKNIDLCQVMVEKAASTDEKGTDSVNSRSSKKRKNRDVCLVEKAASRIERKKKRDVSLVEKADSRRERKKSKYLSPPYTDIGRNKAK